MHLVSSVIWVDPSVNSSDNKKMQEAIANALNEAHRGGDCKKLKKFICAETEEQGLREIEAVEKCVIITCTSFGEKYVKNRLMT